MISRAALKRARRNLDVLAYIESRAAFGVARLSKRDIAQGMKARKGLDISERTVQKALRDLEREGKLRIAMPGPTSGRGTRPILNVRLPLEKGEGKAEKGEGTETVVNASEYDDCNEREKADSGIQGREKASPFPYSPSIRFCRACEETDGWRYVKLNGGRYVQRCDHQPHAEIEDGSPTAQECVATKSPDAQRESHGRLAELSDRKSPEESLADAEREVARLSWLEEFAAHCGDEITVDQRGTLTRQLARAIERRNECLGRLSEEDPWQVEVPDSAEAFT